MRHSMSKDTAFNGETTPRHTFLCSDSQWLPPGNPRILCAKHGSPITGKSFIQLRGDFCRHSLIKNPKKKKKTNLKKGGSISMNFLKFHVQP